MKNIFEVPQSMCVPLREEFFETMLHAQHVRVERIISQGQKSPVGFWYDQHEDEWIVLLQGSAEITTKSENGLCTLWHLKAGDSMLLKAHCKHRVEKTSSTPQAVWLALHGVIF